MLNLGTLYLYFDGNQAMNYNHYIVDSGTLLI